MTAILLTVITSLLTTGVLTAVLSAFAVFRTQIKKIALRALVTGASLAAALFLIALAVDRFTTVSSLIAIPAVILLSALVFGCAVLAPLLQKESVKSFLRRAGAMAVIVFLLEVLLFNVKSYTAKPEKTAIDLSQATVLTADTVTRNEDGSLIFKGNGTVTFALHAENVSALALSFDGEDRWFRATVSVKDDNFSQSFVQVAKKYASTEVGSADFSFRPYGTVYEVKLELTEVSSPITVRSGEWMAKLPFAFSSVRFFALTGLCLALGAVYAFKLYKITYDRRSIKHRVAILVALLICLGGVFAMLNPQEKPIGYPNEELKMSAQDPYVQMFDAFYHDRLHIDIQPSDKLLAMENPYDYSARRAEGVSFAWDRAFYDGHYYSYYGATPVVTFYAPYHFFTGALPTINCASVFFGALAIVFLFGTVLAFTKRFIREPNLLLLLLTLVAAAAICGVYYQVDFSDMYTLPGVTSSCFLFMCLFTGIEACNRQRTASRLVLLSLAGVAFVLCLGARPTKALSALVLAPIFIGVLFERSTVKKKIASAAAFIVPTAIGLAVIMVYNYLRFDSPFEFGAQYQLTVNNVQANSLSLSALPFALMHYFAQPLRLAADFPYVQVAAQSFSSYGSYVYADFAAGALSFPTVLGGLSVLPFHHRFEKKMIRSGERAEYRIKRAFYILALVLAVVIAWLDFCMAGIIMSYVLDIMPLLALLSTFVLLDADKKLSKVEAIGNKGTFIFAFLAAVTLLIAFVMIVSFFNRELSLVHPTFYFRLEELFCFWN